MDSAQLEMPEVKTAEEKKRGVSGSTVKLIAVAAMLIDHIAAVIVARQLMAEGLGEIMETGETFAVMDWMAEHMVIFMLYMAMRMIGRLGFPIFSFLLVEGYQKTRNVKKYIFRMGIFALVSEVPFDLAFNGKILEFGYQNVYFTLFLGLFTLCAYDFFARYRQNIDYDKIWSLAIVLGVLFTVTYATICIQNTFMLYTSEGVLAAFGVMCVIVIACVVLYKKKRGMKRLQVACADMTVLMLAMFLADFMRTDYGGFGVLTITMIYIFRKNKVKSMAAGCTTLTVMSISEITAFFTLIPVALYNGKRGLKMKYFFYAFYPVHLFLLYLIAFLMGMGDIAAI